MAGTLSRGTLVRNANYQRNGLKSYVHALKKFGIGPTIDGPYCMVNQIQQQGSQAILRMTGKKIGGRAHVQGHVLAKKDATSGETGEVPVSLIKHDDYLSNEIKANNILPGPRR